MEKDCQNVSELYVGRIASHFDIDITTLLKVEVLS